MHIYHNSQDKDYRFPKGAVEAGQKIMLALLVKSETLPQKAEIRLWDNGESFIEMHIKENTPAGIVYEGEITAPDAPQLLWYYFVITLDHKKYYYSNNPERLGGVGVMEEFPSDISYQITVYDKAFKTPDWLKDGIIYQIFPDRFFRDGEKTDFPEKRSEYKLHSDWYEGFFFDRHPHEDGPACNDFYGGNLKGIIKKLDYLKELGITIIYLNPIFEAFSNHRYDTGDYSKIDPILGTEEDFTELCQKAEDRGIKIILDGVFSHTGSDSIYFNKYGNYGEGEGAFRDINSPYRRWYQWNGDGSYNSWWGCSNLPNVCETEPTYIEHILKGKDAIIKKWLRLGASGWRLDVADELPDEFIKALRYEVKAEKSDAAIIGEVWEDASNKVSYGQKREYLFGSELDSVMNYPFKDGVLAFLKGERSAEDFSKSMLSIMENYPKEALYSTMNLIDTHDTVRVKTVLSGMDINYNMTNYEKQNFRLDPKAETLAIKRLRLALFMQMTFVGVPSIYYGDEIGMDGLSDPFNRKPYSWRSIDPELLGYYKKMTNLRKDTECLKRGDFEVLYAKGGAFVYKREQSGKGAVVCAVNRDSNPCEIEVKDLKHSLKGFLSGKILDKNVVLEPFEAEIFMK